MPDTVNVIDLVIPWVDGNDPAWQAEKAGYVSPAGGDDRALRYRSWDTLRYLFRGIEKNLPWVRQVYFVTWGHLPPWLDPNCGRLRIVNHRDYIPADYLPTFSSHTIELNLHRIPELSERFIYANDDTFFLRPLAPEFFFREGLPVDRAVQNVLQFARRDGIDHIVANDLTVINGHFSKKEVVKKNPGKWYAPQYGAGMLKNIYLKSFTYFTGFEDFHLPNAFLKSTLQEVWEAEGELLDATCRRKVRSDADVNQWLFRYWQLASGRFVPGKTVPGALFPIGEADGQIEKAILEGGYPMVCLSDNDPDLDFETENRKLCSWLEKRFPEKSGFEK